MRTPPITSLVAAHFAIALASTAIPAQPRQPVITKAGAQLSAMLQPRRLPSVIDSTVDVARRMLSPFRLNVTLTTRDTPNAALDGRVFSQLPGARAPIPTPGSTVELGVYRYIPVDSVIVPAVRGLPLAMALRVIQNARLSPRFPGSVVPSRVAATVAEQVPEPGTRVAAGDTVSLTIEVAARVPWVVGRDVATATQLLARRGLVLTPDGGDYSDSIPTGRITRQHPDSGASARPGDAVTVWTSLGPHPPAPTATMPRLVGLTLGEAATALQPLQLAIAHVDTVVDPARAGRITAQKPVHEAPVRPRDHVEVQVAVAPREHRVPWVVGMPWQRAAAVLTDSSFGASVQLAPGDGRSRGTVVAQSVDSGVTRPPRTTIALTVVDTAAPPPPQSRLMPNVVGMPRESAVDALGFLSPRLTIVEQATTSEREDGRVAGQAPNEGDVVFPPVDVVLRVSRFQPPTPTPPADSAVVPDLVGRPLAEARDLLAGARLAVGDVVATDAGADSVVAQQDPGAGLVLAAGTPVALTLQVQTVPPPRRFPIWPFVVAAAGVLAAYVIARSRPRPPSEDSPDRPRADAIVTLHPSPLGPPLVQVRPDESIVANEVTLVDLAPEIEIDFPGTLTAREEVQDARERR